jgi:hypothetical protein
MTDQELGQGSIITVEFDKVSAPLGFELAEPGMVGGEIAQIVRVLEPRRRIDDDFNAGAYIIEFVVIAAANISVGAAIGLIKGLINRRAAQRGLTTDVHQLPRAPLDTSVRLAVTSDSGD